MKTDQDFHDPEVTQCNTLPTPLNKDHNYFSVPVDRSYSTAAWNCNHDYSADVTAGRKEKPFTDVIKDWKPLSGVRTHGKLRSDVTAGRNPRSDVISARKPSTDSKISRMTCSDVIESGNLPYDVRKSGKPLDDVSKMGKSFSEMKASKNGRNVSFPPGSRQKENAGDAFDIFSDSKDTASPYGMLIDEEVIGGSLLSQAKTVKEESARSGSRMKLDSRYRTNSSDSAFSEDSLLEDDEDAKLETLISQFIFNPTNLQNDFTEYVESNHNAAADDVDVDELDVTDLFNSAAMFDPDLGGPTSPGFAAAERESGLGSSENSICSDNRDSSPVKRHKIPLLQKNDSISSLSSSSSSSSSASSSSSSSSSASLSLSSLSLDALSSTVAKSSFNAQRFDDLHVTSVPAGENEALEQTGACGGSPVTVSWQARDGETCALSPAVEGRGNNSDNNQGGDSTGFITLPIAHLAAKTTTTINNTISHGNNNNNDDDDDDDNKDNYDVLLTHLRNGFQPPFEIRGDNPDLLLDEPDFVDFPFPTETQNCRPNLPDTPTSPGGSLAGGSLAGFHSYESDALKAKQNQPAFLLERPEGGEKVLDESFATAVLYLAQPPSTETPELTLKYVNYFNDYFEVGPKRDKIEECYSEAVTSQSPFPDWFSIDESRIESGMINSALTSSLNLTEIYEPKEAKHRKSDDPEIVKVTADSTSTPKYPHTDTSQNIDDVQSYALNSGEIHKSVRLLCSVKKCTSSKRPVQTLNSIKKVPIKKKSSFQGKKLPVSDENTLKVDCHEFKTISRVSGVPILGTPQLNRTECNLSKSTHSSPRIEILSWDDTGSLHVKVPKLSVNNKESRNSQNRVQCSLLREALTAEEPQPRFFESIKEGKHKNTKSKPYRNESPGFPNETLTGAVEIPASTAKSSWSEMSELEKYLRGIIPTEAASEGRGKTSGCQNSDQEDSAQVSFLRKLLTGEMSTHTYREIDRRMCEKKRREIK